MGYFQGKFVGFEDTGGGLDAFCRRGMRIVMAEPFALEEA